MKELDMDGLAGALSVLGGLCLIVASGMAFGAAAAIAAIGVFLFMLAAGAHEAHRRGRGRFR